jgi:hypothetical protein
MMYRPIALGLAMLAAAALGAAEPAPAQDKASRQFPHHH